MSPDRSRRFRMLMLSLAFALSRAAAQGDVVPGITLRAAAPRGVDTIVYARTITHDGRDSSEGTRTVTLREIDRSGGPAQLEVGQRFAGGGGEIFDTAVAELATWRAVAHRSHQPSRTMRFDFSADTAAGTVRLIRPGGDSVIAVRQPLGGAIFDSNVIEMVVGALPLRDGFTADLPFFIYERGGRVSMAVTVRERATETFARFGARDVWVVAVAVPGAPATVWVDTRTHAVLRVRYELTARAMRFTDERITPLRG